MGTPIVEALVRLPNPEAPSAPQEDAATVSDPEPATATSHPTAPSLEKPAVGTMVESAGAAVPDLGRRHCRGDCRGRRVSDLRVEDGRSKGTTGWRQGSAGGHWHVDVWR